MADLAGPRADTPHLGMRGQSRKSLRRPLWHRGAISGALSAVPPDLTYFLCHVRETERFRVCVHSSESN